MWRTGHVPQTVVKKHDEADDPLGHEEDNGSDTSSVKDDPSSVSDADEETYSKTQAIKREFPDLEDDSGEPKKKSKKLKKELFRPPTSEEMNQLRETEYLFHSNLFRLQIAEMLKEVTIQGKHKDLFKAWFQNFQTHVGEIKKSKEVKLGDLSKLTKHGIQLPIPVDVSKFKKTFQFQPPSDVSIIGSYATNCRLGPKFEVDIKIEIPQKCLLRTDYHNQYYLLKRALYTAHLARYLKNWNQVKSVKFTLQEGDPLKPVIQLIPEGDLGDHATVILYAIGPEDCFKFSQLAPDKANVKSKWLTGQECEDGVDPPTPRYNRCIAVDLAMVRNESFLLQTLETQTEIREGIMLLKIWLHQRGFDQGYGCFSGFIMSMYVLHLFLNRRVNAMMSSYQVVRNTWVCLAQADWTEKGISLADSTSEPSITDFHLLCDVVFLDVTGFVNLCGNMSKTTFLTVRNECMRAIQCLDNPNINSFQALFMTSIPFLHKYDHLISFYDKNALISAEKKLSYPAWKLDCAGPWLVHDSIVSLLRQGLESRVKHIAVQHQPAPVWSLTENMPDPRSKTLILGIELDPDEALRLIDKGPAANTSEASDFRAFWGEKSEIRRFRDGSICEAVVWNAQGVAQRRLLCRELVFHILKTHLDIDPSCVLYIADQFDVVLQKSEGEEGALAVTQACDALGRQLMQLEGLPLSISSVQGSAPCLRYADPFPPKPSRNPPSKVFTESVCLKTSEIKYIRYLAPIPMILTLALSSKWPDDLQAIRRIKAAFYLKIAELVHSQLELPVQAYPEFVDVLKDGFVLRLQVAHTREISLLKEIITSQGQIRYKDNETSMALEMTNSHLPKLTAVLHGLHMTHPAFGPACCLAKRWVASHMLLDDVLMPETCVELIMAFLFLHPEPYRPAVQPQVAFLRFLELLSKEHWAAEPFILNFNNEISREEVINLENHFHSERATLPQLIIATPESRSGTVWTRHAPTVPIVYRLHYLAVDTLATLTPKLTTFPTWDTKTIFRNTLSLYDVVIYLDAKLTRRDEAVDSQTSTVRQGSLAVTNNRIPVVGLDLVQCYLRELRDAYDEYALFFYDRYGGYRIAVLFKPDALKPKLFRVSQIAGQEPVPPDNMQFNKTAFITDLKIIGDSLVTHVEEKIKIEAV